MHSYSRNSSISRACSNCGIISCSSSVAFDCSIFRYSWSIFYILMTLFYKVLKISSKLFSNIWFSFEEICTSRTSAVIAPVMNYLSSRAWDASSSGMSSRDSTNWTNPSWISWFLVSYFSATAFGEFGDFCICWAWSRSGICGCISYILIF